MKEKITELQQAALNAKAAPVWEKGERIGEVVDLLVDVLFDFEKEVEALKGAQK